MNIKQQQEIAADVLKDLLHTVDSSAIIAGGAPRNWDEGKLANDIDIYLRSYAIDTLSMIEEMLTKALGFKVEQCQDIDMSKYHFGITFSIQRIFAFKHKGVLFQLVFIQPGEAWVKGQLSTEVINHIDVGLNMVYASWDFVFHNKKLNKTEQYNKDRRDKTLTLYKDNMNEGQLRHCIDAHLPKMQGYYPDHRLVLKAG